MKNQHHTTKTHVFRALLIGVSMLASLAVGPTSSASAWAWDPKVTLNGRATCSPGIGSTVEWMWVSASNGESGWATLSGSGITRQYQFSFKRIPTTGVVVNIEYGCRHMGSSRTRFGLQRPAVGNWATRNLCPAWWSGPCLI
jgi:hypothetical protein